MGLPAQFGVQVIEQQGVAVKGISADILYGIGGQPFHEPGSGYKLFDFFHYVVN